MCEKMTSHVIEHRGQQQQQDSTMDPNDQSSNCACQACMERKFLEREQIRDVQDLQKCWMQLRHSIRQMYRDRLTRDFTTGKGKKIDQAKIKDLVNKLASRDPHQLYQRLECQAREHVMDLKVQLLQILVSPEDVVGLISSSPVVVNNNSDSNNNNSNNDSSEIKSINSADNEKSLTSQLTSDVAKHFISSLLTFAGLFFETVENMRFLLEKLEKEHLDVFGITWRIVNCNLFDAIIFQDPLIQVSLPAIYKQLGFSSLKLNEVNFDELSNRNLIARDLSEMMKSYVELYTAMTACREQMGKAQERMEDYLAQQMKIYQATLKAKQKMLKEDLEFFKHQRRLLEEYVSKKKELKKVSTSSNGDDEEMSSFVEALRGLLTNNRPIRAEHSASTAECMRCRQRHCPCDECAISHFVTCGLIGEDDEIELPDSFQLFEEHHDELTSNSSSSDSDESEYGSSVDGVGGGGGGGCTTIEENYANMDIVCRKRMSITCSNGQKVTKVETTILPSSLYPFQNPPGPITRHVYHAYGDWEVSSSTDPSSWFLATATTNRCCPAADKSTPIGGGGSAAANSAPSTTTKCNAPSLSLLRCRAAKRQGVAVGVAKLKAHPPQTTRLVKSSSQYVSHAPSSTTTSNHNNCSKSSSSHHNNFSGRGRDKPDFIQDVLKQLENNHPDVTWQSEASARARRPSATCDSVLTNSVAAVKKCSAHHQQQQKRDDKKAVLTEVNKSTLPDVCAKLTDVNNKSLSATVNNNKATSKKPPASPSTGSNPFLNNNNNNTTAATPGGGGGSSAVKKDAAAAANSATAKCTAAAAAVQASPNFDKVPPELLKIMKDEKLAKALALAASKRNLTTTANQNSTSAAAAGGGANGGGGGGGTGLAGGGGNKNCHLSSTEPYWKDLNLDVETVRKIYNSQQTTTHSRGGSGSGGGNSNSGGYHGNGGANNNHNNHHNANNNSTTTANINSDKEKNLSDSKNNSRQSQSVGTQVDPVQDDDEDSWSDRSSCSPKDSKHCDCCYCEMFGQGNNRFGRDDFPQIRERLRLKLKKKGNENATSDCQTNNNNNNNTTNNNNQTANQNNPPAVGGGGATTVLSEQVKGYRGADGLDALLEYIEGGSSNSAGLAGRRSGQKMSSSNASSCQSTNSNNSGSTAAAVGAQSGKSTSSASKRQRQKQKKVTEKPPRCETTNQNSSSIKNGSSATNQNSTTENLPINDASPKKKGGKKKLNVEETLNVDEVFKPKDIDLNSTELDEVDKEVEKFKRFVSDCRPREKREKVQLNLGNLLNLVNNNRRNDDNKTTGANDIPPPPEIQRHPQTMSC